MVSNSKLMKIMLLSTLFGAAGATPVLAALASLPTPVVQQNGQIGGTVKDEMGPVADAVGSVCKDR